MDESSILYTGDGIFAIPLYVRQYVILIRNLISLYGFNNL